MRLLLAAIGIALALLVSHADARMSGQEQQAFDSLNAYRVSLGLNPLIEDGRLDDMAQELANNTAMDTCWQFDIYYACSLSGWGFHKGTDFMGALKNSTEHDWWLRKPELVLGGVGHRGDYWVLAVAWPQVQALTLSDWNCDGGGVMDPRVCWQ